MDVPSVISLVSGAAACFMMIFGIIMPLWRRRSTARAAAETRRQDAADTEHLVKLRADLSDDDRKWLAEHGATWLDEPKIVQVTRFGYTYSQADTTGRTDSENRENAVRRLQRPAIGCTEAEAQVLVDEIGIDEMKAKDDAWIAAKVRHLTGTLTDEEVAQRIESSRYLNLLSEQVKHLGVPLTDGPDVTG